MFPLTLLKNLRDFFHSIKDYIILILHSKKTSLIMINNIFLKISTIGILSFAFARSEGVAICVDVAGRVSREGSVRNGLIRKGDIIYHGDKLITGKNAFSSIFFSNQKITANVYDHTSVKIFYNKSINGGKYEIAIFGGKVITKMSSDKKLLISAPSSEAIAQGAHLMFEYRNDLLFEEASYSIFSLISGKLKIKNEISMQSIYPEKGQTIISTRSGKIFQLDTFKNSGLISNYLKNIR